MTFDVIREPSEANLMRNVSRTDVVLLAFANDNFYLNVIQELNEQGIYEPKGMEFQRWQNLKSIDFNGWWQIEVMDDSSQITLRNFNSGKYISFCENEKRIQSPFEFVDDSTNASVFTLTPVNSSEVDVGNYEESHIFKIKVTDKGYSEREKYLCIGSFYFSDDTFESNRDDESQLALARSQYKTNTLDTFKFIFPKEEEYMELSL